MLHRLRLPDQFSHELALPHAQRGQHAALVNLVRDMGEINLLLRAG
jgi:hypothetical protein